jgi:DNA-binding NarL/FixJ family response regulator
MIRIIIADDHPLIREGIKRLIENESDMEIVGEASTSAEVNNLIRGHSVDVLLLDISMPDRNGLELLKDLKYAHPKLPVLMLSMYPESQYGIRSLKAGAFGYVTKESVATKLIEAIKKVADGGKYISASLAEKLADHLIYGSDKSLYEFLSDREFQVMQLIASGKSVSVIAAELSLSERTIHTYRRRLFKKMDLNSNAELIQYAFRNNIVK